MVKRAATFFKQFGPVVSDCPVLSGGYTDTIVNGDGDFTTKDTIWNFKASRNEPTIYNTLQVVVYNLMAKHSTVPEYKDLKKIGLFNPRLNAAYVLDMSKLPDTLISDIEQNLIGYTE